jgi:glycosyltransferase involved in cell wall biosynthesis
MTVAALVVTNRPQFIEWFTYQIGKQTRKPDEVVIVTNSTNPDAYDYDRIADRTGVENVVIYKQPPESWVSLGYLRQKALDLCQSDLFAFFDDDDWYHPRRLELCAAPIESGRFDAAVLPLTHFYSVQEKIARTYPGGTGLHLPATTWRRESVRKARFFHLPTAEDNHWVHRVVHCKWTTPLVPRHRVYWVPDYVEPYFGGIVLVHANNTWQDADRIKTATDLYIPANDLPTYPSKDITREDWGFLRSFVASLPTDNPVKHTLFHKSPQDRMDEAHRSSLYE